MATGAQKLYLDISARSLQVTGNRVSLKQGLVHGSKGQIGDSRRRLLHAQ